MPVVYVARRRLRVGGRDVMPGDEVPEASSWRKLPVYVHNGSLALVQTDVHYARGNLQRRPDTTRGDYRKRGMERWHGEIRYGNGSEPDVPVPTITGVWPDPARIYMGIGQPDLLEIDGTGLSAFDGPDIDPDRVASVYPSPGTSGTRSLGCEGWTVFSDTNAICTLSNSGSEANTGEGPATLYLTSNYLDSDNAIKANYPGMNLIYGYSRDHADA